MDAIPAPIASNNGPSPVPPAINNWITYILGVAVATLGVLTECLPDSRPIMVAFKITVALGIFQGMSSQGLRFSATVKSLALVLVPMLALGATGCANLTPYESRVIDCAKEAGTSLLKNEVSIALNKPDWSAQLDALILASGNAAICAIGATIAELESSDTRQLDGAPYKYASVPLTRARVYFATHPLK